MEKFSELEYVRPDFEALRETASALLERFKRTTNYETARSLFLELQHVCDDADTMTAIASIRNTADLSDKFYEE